MILRLSRIRRNANENVFNDRKNVSATPVLKYWCSYVRKGSSDLIVQMSDISVYFTVNLPFPPQPFSCCQQ